MYVLAERTHRQRRRPSRILQVATLFESDLHVRFDLPRLPFETDPQTRLDDTRLPFEPHL